MSEPFPPPPPTSPPPSAQPFLPMVLGPLGGTALPGPAEAWRARPYSQMLRGPNHAWWRPLVSTLVVGLWLIGLVVAFGVLLAAAMATSGVLGPDDAPSRAQLDEWGASPSGLLLINLSLALLIPIAQSAVWAGHGWRPRWVASVTGGVRWVWLVRCYLASLVVLVVVNGVLVAIDGGLGEIALERQAGSYALVILLTTPLQAAGEEYLFRGWMTQAIGALFAKAAVGAVAAAVGSSLVFALAHGQQDPWLFGDRLAFGLVASWLVWRTGGLEASIALHGANNLLALGLAVLTGHVSEMMTATGADPLMLGVDVLIMVVSAFVLDRLARRTGVLRMFRPPGVA